MCICRGPRKRRRRRAGNDLTRVLLAALAKETPWIAIVGAGLAGAANLFLNRNKAAEIIVRTPSPREPGTVGRTFLLNGLDRGISPCLVGH